MKRPLFVIVLLLLFAASLYLLWTGLGSTAYILILAFALAYLFHPLIIVLERNGVSRNVATISTFVLIFGGLALGLFFFIPWFIEEMTKLVVQLPTLLSNAIVRLNVFLERFNLHVPETPRSILNLLIERLAALDPTQFKPGLDFVKSLLSQAVAGLLGILNFFLFPIFFLFLTHDYERILAAIKNLVPYQYRPWFLAHARRFDDILAGFVRGQVIVCTALAFMYSIGLHFSNVPFGALIGLTSGILSFIPYVGAAVGIATSLLVSWASGAELFSFIGIAATFGIAQSIESFYLTPKLVGNRVGLSYLGAMLALVFGANWGGFWGVVFAIPIAAFVQILVIEIIAWYKASDLYQQS